MRFSAAVCVFVLLLVALTICATATKTQKRAATSSSSSSVPPQLSSTYYKHLAGSPSEFPLHVLPTPSQSAIESHTTLLPFTLQPNAVDRTLVGMETKFPVDSVSEFRLSILSPILNDLVIEIAPPNTKKKNQLFNAADLARQYCQAAGVMTGDGEDVVDGDFGDGAIRVPSRTFSFPKPEAGLWLLRITSKESALASFVDPIQPHLFVLLDMESELNTWTHINSYDLETGKQIGLVTRLIDTNKRQSTSSQDGTPVPIRFTPDTVVMEIRLPDGQQEEIPMKDDGLHFDGVANDGVYGATIVATEEGAYSFQVVMHGTTSDGREFLRTSEHIIETVDDDFTLTGEVLAEMSPDDKALMLSLIGSWTPSQTEFTFKGYMEVWGVDAETGSKNVPIAWVGGLADAQPAPPGALQGAHSLTFRLDTNWIAMANAKAPFTLRNIYIQDRLNSIPLTQLAEAPVKLRRFAASRHFETLRFDGSITEEMIKGPRPAFLANPNNATTAEGHRLVLVHGYCAPAISWKLSDFTDYALFEDFDQNRRNDEFARLIVQFAGQFSSFSLISHSQGGLASLHLFTYYWSGADNANGKRFLQSVGSPYQGNGLAGILAKIGSWLGIGCDTNFDLTYDGAKLWLSSVPAAARSQVDYYTTQYKPFSWCNLAANAVLKWPNDGVVEKDNCQLPGGNNKGHKEKWCHTANMKYPPQTTDSDRNRILNQNAHRG